MDQRLSVYIELSIKFATICIKNEKSAFLCNKIENWINDDWMIYLKNENQIKHFPKFVCFL